jgi:hypothetical protein
MNRKPGVALVSWTGWKAKIPGESPLLRRIP